MTFQTAKFIRKIKKAQICEDWAVQINFATMTVETYNRDPDNTAVIKLKKFRKSIHSILAELKKQDYIILDEDFGYAKLTHSGWHARELTVQSALKFTVKDIIVPLIVTAIANFLPEMIQLIQAFFHF